MCFNALNGMVWMQGYVDDGFPDDISATMSGRFCHVIKEFPKYTQTPK